MLQDVTYKIRLTPRPYSIINFLERCAFHYIQFIDYGDMARKTFDELNRKAYIKHSIYKFDRDKLADFMWFYRLQQMPGSFPEDDWPRFRVFPVWYEFWRPGEESNLVIQRHEVVELKKPTYKQALLSGYGDLDRLNQGQDVYDKPWDKKDNSPNVEV